ncbi:hypothetical protein FJZ18_02465 [Candidatus Pacearchaeota archaeon]|nr:hypothetical protein [Candidatus Pacearchaeota archaeon]
MKYTIILGLLMILLVSPLMSALQVSDITAPTIQPGQEGTITIILENEGSKAVEDISVSLDFTGLPFIPIGGSEASVNKLNEDREKVLSFKIRASPDSEPGDYKVPYTINGKNITQKKGTIGLSITGNSVLSFNTQIEKPVVGERSKVTLRIVNSGLTDARFVSLRAIPERMTILSESQIYVGTINSDDFESVSFDTLFFGERPSLTVVLTYKDFNNKDLSMTENVPLTIYSRERALEFGIIKKDNSVQVIFGLIVLIAIWIIWRAIRKRQRLRKSKELALRK